MCPSGIVLLLLSGPRAPSVGAGFPSAYQVGPMLFMVSDAVPSLSAMLWSRQRGMTRGCYVEDSMPWKLRKGVAAFHQIIRIVDAPWAKYQPPTRLGHRCDKHTCRSSTHMYNIRQFEAVMWASFLASRKSIGYQVVGEADRTKHGWRKAMCIEWETLIQAWHPRGDTQS